MSWFNDDNFVVQTTTLAPYKSFPFTAAAASGCNGSCSDDDGGKTRFGTPPTSTTVDASDGVFSSLLSDIISSTVAGWTTTATDFFETTDDDDINLTGGVNVTAEAMLDDVLGSGGPREFNGLDDECSAFRFGLNAVVVGLVCVFGIAGNSVSLVVLHRDRHNRVAVFLLQTLAFVDNLNLVMSLVFLSIIYGLLPTVGGPESMARAIPYVVRYGNTIGYVAQALVIWITVLLGVNRYVAICIPYRAKSWLTLCAARVQVLNYRVT